LFACFFFKEHAPTQIYPLSLHDALPIFAADRRAPGLAPDRAVVSSACALSLEARKTGSKAKSTARPAPTRSSRIAGRPAGEPSRSEEHTSELQSRSDLVCRLLLEKKTYQ